MWSPAEPQTQSAEQTPLTASALSQLDAQVAAAANRQRSPQSRGSHAVCTPDLQGTNPSNESTKNDADFESCVATRAPSQIATIYSQHISPHQHITQLAQAVHQDNAPMPDYVVDGLIYRSPDTLNTLIGIADSPGKGAGVFALRDMLPQTLLLSERPLIQLADDGSRHDPLDTLVDALPLPLKKAYRSLHGYQQVTAVRAPPQSPPLIPTLAGASPPPAKKHRVAAFPPQRQSLNRRVLYSNGFATGPTTTGVFEVASRINHSCVANAVFSWDAEAGRMNYVAVAKLLEGEEVTIDYGHTRRHLAKYYGFECDCGGCTEWGSTSTASTAGGGADKIGDGKGDENGELEKEDQVYEIRGI